MTLWIKKNSASNTLSTVAREYYTTVFSTPSGLAEWFCDDVNIKKDVHTFFWDGSEEAARLVSKKKDEYVKFKWLEAEEDRENTFFELRIKVDEMTGDRAIIITDFAEEDEVEDAKELWMAQLDKLKRVFRRLTIS